jgi:hypothetical protein
MSYFAQTVITNIGGTLQADINSETVTALGLNTLPLAVSTGDWYPRYLASLNVGDKATLLVDTAGNLVCRSAVLTDEGSLYEPFSGTSLDPIWVQKIGTGGSISVADSECVISSGTTAGETTGISKQIDFSPLDLSVTFSISQRIANHTFMLDLRILILFLLLRNLQDTVSMEQMTLKYVGKLKRLQILVQMKG